jgi:branched-chain amino acid aminotransferase
LSECRVRVTIFRGDGGLYDPVSNLPHYIIQVWPLAFENGKLNDNGLQVCIYKDAAKGIDSFSNLKHNNFLPYLMAAFHARENKCNDALVLNSKGNICDSSIANIFTISNNTIFTPPLSEGCIAGVMRKFLITALAGSAFEIVEKELTIEDLADADEIFLTNSVYNIRWVAGLENRVYSNQQVKALDMHLRQTNPGLYC